MTEEKKIKLITAGTATAVVLLFVLVVTLVFQLVSMGVKQNVKRKLESEIAYYEDAIAKAEGDIELWQEEWMIEERARQLDYVFRKENDE